MIDEVRLAFVFDNGLMVCGVVFYIIVNDVLVFLGVSKVICCCVGNFFWLFCSIG